MSVIKSNNQFKCKRFALTRHFCFVTTSAFGQHQQHQELYSKDHRKTSRSTTANVFSSYYYAFKANTNRIHLYIYTRTYIRINKIRKAALMNNKHTPTH